MGIPKNGLTVEHQVSDKTYTVKIQKKLPLKYKKLRIYMYFNSIFHCNLTKKFFGKLFASEINS